MIDPSHFCSSLKGDRYPYTNEIPCRIFPTTDVLFFFFCFILFFFGRGSHVKQKAALKCFTFFARVGVPIPFRPSPFGPFCIIFHFLFYILMLLIIFGQHMMSAYFHILFDIV